jgi:hypothetical protein
MRNSFQELYKINMLLVNTVTDKCLMSSMIRSGNKATDQHIMNLTNAALM